MPALLKQRLDDVFTTEWLFGSGGKAVTGKEIVLALSIGGDQSSYQSGGMIGYTISELVRPLASIAGFLLCLFKIVPPCLESEATVICQVKLRKNKAISETFPNFGLVD